MQIIIYFDHKRKNRQIIRPAQRPECSVRDIVQTVTHSNTIPQWFCKNYYSYDVIG